MPPPSIGREKDKAAARPAQKTCAVQAALFSLTVGLSGARSDSGRFGFRENPRHRTRGVPHVELARPAFSATVTVPLRLRWRAARWPGATPPRRPGLAPLAEGCCPTRRKKTGFRQVARSTAPQNPGPSRLRRVRCPGRWSGPCALTGRRAQIFCLVRYRPTGPAIGAGATPRQGPQHLCPRGQYFVVWESAYTGTFVSLPGRASAADPLTSNPAAGGCERIPRKARRYMASV